METFYALLAVCAGNSPVTGEFPAQRPVTRSFDVFFYLCVNERLSKQWGWWFETPPRPLWRHCNALMTYEKVKGNLVYRNTLKWKNHHPNCFMTLTRWQRPWDWHGFDIDLTWSVTLMSNWCGSKGLCYLVNTLRSRQNGRHFTDDTFKRIFLNENDRILIKMSLKFFS